MDPKDIPAFPHHFTHESIGDYSGMTLRDYFAAKAMQSLVLAAYTSSVQVGAESEVAQQAYSFADAMLAEREE